MRCDRKIRKIDMCRCRVQGRTTKAVNDDEGKEQNRFSVQSESKLYPRYASPERCHAWCDIVGLGPVPAGVNVGVAIWLQGTDRSSISGRGAGSIMFCPGEWRRTHGSKRFNHENHKDWAATKSANRRYGCEMWYSLDWLLSVALSSKQADCPSSRYLKE